MAILPEELPLRIRPLRKQVDVLMLLDEETQLPIPAVMNKDDDFRKAMNDAELDQLMTKLGYERTLDGLYQRKPVFRSS